MFTGHHIYSWSFQFLSSSRFRKLQRFHMSKPAASSILTKILKVPIRSHKMHLSVISYLQSLKPAINSAARSLKKVTHGWSKLKALDRFRTGKFVSMILTQVISCIMHPMFRQWHIISPTQACKVGWKVPASWGRLNCCTQPWLIAMAFETPLERCQALERFGSCTRQVLKTRPVQPRLVTMETRRYLCDQCVHICCSLSHLQWGISIVCRSSIGSHRRSSIVGECWWHVHDC